MKKSLIASVSIISMIAGLNCNTFAGPVTRTANVNTDITNGVGFSPNGFNDGDNISFENTCTVSFTTNPNHIVNDINFNSFDGVISIASGINVTTNSIVSNIFPYVGSIIFDGDSIFDGTIGGPGGGQSVKLISIGDGTVTLTSNLFYAADANLITANSFIKFSGLDTVANCNINNTSGKDGSGGIIISNNATFTGLVGSDSAKFKEITFLTDSLVTANNSNTRPIGVVDIYPDSSLGNGKGSLLLKYDADTYDGQPISNIGISNLKINTLSLYSTISDSPTNNHIANIKSDKAVYVNKIDIYPYTLTKTILDQSTLNIETNTTVNALITRTPPINILNSVGIVNIEGSSTMSGGIGEADNLMPGVNFTSTTSSDVVRFTGDIYATNITQASPNLTLTQNSRFSTTNGYNNQNSTHSLGLNTFTIQSPIEDGPILFREIKNNNGISGAAVINTTANSSTAGNIVIDGGTFTIGGEGGVTSMTLNLVDLTTTIPVGGKKSYTILGNTVNDGVIIIPDDSIVNFDVLSSTNPFVYWTYSNGVITQIFIPNPAPVIKEAAIAAVNNPTTTTISNITIISDSNANVDLANAILAGPDAVTELVDRLLISITEVTEDSFDIIEGVIGDVSANLNKKTEIALVSADDPILQGISAGDAANRYGAWTIYSYSDNTQGARGVKPGYKSKSNSVTIGADTLVSDETALGFAVGYIDTNVVHKDSNIGDKSKVKTILLSLYSVTELMNNWYIQAQGIFGQSKINNAELRGSFANRETAKAKFKSNAYAASIETGYNFLTEYKIMVTPVIGMEYDVIGKSHYLETGTTNQNLNVHKSNQKKLIAHTGLIVAKNFKVGDTSLVPEIYGMIRHDFLNTNLKVNSKLEGVQDSLITRTAQNGATFYNFGLGVTSVIQNTDLTLGYDYYFGEKYTSHQGSIKLRLNF